MSSTKENTYVSKAKATKPSAISPSSEGVYVANAIYNNNSLKAKKISKFSCCLDNYNNTESTFNILLTREELSARWKYCVETLKRWEKAGKLPFLVLGKEIRYRLSVIMHIEANSEVPLI